MHSHLLIPQQHFQTLRLNRLCHLQRLINCNMINESLQSIHLEHRDIHRSQVLQSHHPSIRQQVPIDLVLQFQRVI